MMQTYRSVIAGALLSTMIGSGGLKAQQQPPPDLIQQLQRRIDELEQKVKALETGREVKKEGAETNAPQRIQELDQKVKILERNRELDEEAAEARLKEAPRI